MDDLIVVIFYAQLTANRDWLELEKKAWIAKHFHIPRTFGRKSGPTTGVTTNKFYIFLNTIDSFLGTSSYNFRLLFMQTKK